MALIEFPKYENNNSKSLNEIPMLGMDEVKNRCKDSSVASISEILNGKKYSMEAATDWTNLISNMVVQKMKEVDGYKFFVTTIIMNKGETGLTMAGACLWNSEKDGSHVEKQEIEDMVAIVNIFFSQVN